MLNVFGKKTPSQADQRKLDDALAEEDVSRILQVFKIGDSSDVLLSKSENALVKPTACVDALKVEWETGTERVDLKRSALQFGIETDVLRKLLERDGDRFIFSQNYDFILSRTEESNILSALEKEASQRYLDASVICSQFNLSPSSLQNLIGRSLGRQTLQMLSLGKKDYITLDELKIGTEESISQTINDAERGNKKASWQPSDFRGLPPDLFLTLVRKILEKSSKPSLQEYVTLGDSNVVTYTPFSYFDEQRDKLVSNVTSGSIPFLDVRSILAPHQSLDGKEFSELLRSLSQHSSCIVLGDWAISTAKLDEELATAREIVDSQGYFNLQEIVSRYPSPIQDELSGVVKSRISDGKEIRLVGEYAMRPSWINELHRKAEHLASLVAVDVWKLDEQRPKASSLSSRLRDRVFQEVNDNSLLEELWRDGDVSLANAATEAYNRTITDLERDCEDQFVVLWRFRIVDKVRIHVRGLSELEDEALKGQLGDSLLSYMVTDLIPSTIARAKSKNLLRGSRLKLASRVPKLQTSMEQKGLEDSLQELEKFNGQLGIQDYSRAEMAERRDAYLKDMAALMMKDADAARLFIRLLIILLAKEGEGALYATGKFAPKLLKQLKSHVEEADAAWLEQVKSSIKAGSVSEEMREAMREKAAKRIDYIT